jgi:hypothetical protein
MADLFSMTAPLLIRYPDGTRHVMVAQFPHPDGLVYFRTFWDQLPQQQGVQLVRGELRGTGPWKVGAAVITVLGCHGSNPDEAAEFSEWQFHLEQLGGGYPGREQLQQIARDAGCLP